MWFCDIGVGTTGACMFYKKKAAHNNGVSVNSVATLCSIVLETISGKCRLKDEPRTDTTLYDIIFESHLLGVEPLKSLTMSERSKQFNIIILFVLRDVLSNVLMNMPSFIYLHFLEKCNVMLRDRLKGAFRINGSCCNNIICHVFHEQQIAIIGYKEPDNNADSSMYSYGVI